jgi:hypothetical protein
LAASFKKQNPPGVNRRLAFAGVTPVTVLEISARHSRSQINGAQSPTTWSGTMKTKQIQSSDQISDRELDKVTGGRKAGEGQKDFLKVTMKEVFISGV